MGGGDGGWDDAGFDVGKWVGRVGGVVEREDEDRVVELGDDVEVFAWRQVCSGSKDETDGMSGLSGTRLAQQGLTSRHYETPPSGTT